MSETQNQADEILEDDGAIVGDIDPVTLAMFKDAGVGPFAGEDDEDMSTDVDDEDVSQEDVDDVDTSVPDKGTTVPDEGTYAFELDDGTKVTLEEAQGGYLRQADYTRKTQELAAERKEIQEAKSLVDYIKQNPDLLKVVTGYMHTGVIETPVTSTQATAPAIVIPETHKGDPFVEGVVEVIGDLKKEIAELKGTTTNITQQSQANKQQSEFQTKLYAKFNDSYSWLKGQVENPPAPDEFSDRVMKYFTDNGVDPNAGASQIVTSVDPNYLTGLVERIFSEDIQKAKQSKSNGVEQKRKKRTAKGATLRASGKSGKAPKRPLPKRSDGTVDQEELGRWIIDPTLADRV